MSNRRSSGPNCGGSNGQDSSAGNRENDSVDNRQSDLDCNWEGYPPGGGVDFRECDLALDSSGG